MHGIVHGAEITQTQRTVLNLLESNHPHWRHTTQIASVLGLTRFTTGTIMHSLSKLNLIELKQFKEQEADKKRTVLRRYYRISERGNKLLRTLEELDTVQ